MYGLLAWWDGFPPHEACSFSNNTEAHRTLFCQAQQNGCHPMYTNNLEEPIRSQIWEKQNPLN